MKELKTKGVPTKTTPDQIGPKYCYQNGNISIDMLKDTYSLPLGWGGPSWLHTIYSLESGGSHQRLVLSKVGPERGKMNII